MILGPLSFFLLESFARKCLGKSGIYICGLSTKIIDKKIDECLRKWSIYQNIQGYTRIYKDIQGCIRMYKDIQGYTRIYNDIQGYTRIYKNIQG